MHRHERARACTNCACTLTISTFLTRIKAHHAYTLLLLLVYLVHELLPHPTAGDVMFSLGEL